VIPVVRK